jgi:hypothetical protein
MSSRLLPALALALALPPAAAASEPRILAAPRAVDGATVAVVVEVPAAGSALAETYVVLLERGANGVEHRGAVLIGLGAIVDGIDLGDRSLDVAFREHWPVDRPGAPTRARVRAYPLHAGVTTPAWATGTAVTTPAWAAAADVQPYRP